MTEAVLVSPPPIRAANMRHIILGFATLACLLTAAYVAVMEYYTRLSYQATQWTEHSYQVLKNREGIIEAVFDMFAVTRDHVISGSASAPERLAEHRGQLFNQFSLLQQLTADNPEQQDNVRRLEASGREFSQLCEQQLAIEPLGYSEKTATQNESYRQQLVRSSAAIMQQLDHFTKVENRVLDQRRQRADAERRSLRTVLMAGGATIFLLFALGAGLILRLQRQNDQARERLQRSDERLRLVTEGVSEGVYDIDYVTGLTYVSPSYQAMLGYAAASFKSTEDFLDDYIHPDDLPRVMAHFARYKKRELPSYTTTYRLRHHDGHWLWVLSRAIGIWDAAGRLQRIIGTHTNITEQKNREAQLQELNAELENMTYIASHDLQTPLVNFRGFMGEIALAAREAQQLIEQRRDTLPADLHQQLVRLLRQDLGESLAFVEGAIRKMEKLVGDILDLSRIGRRVGRIEPVNVNQIVDHCIRSMAYEIGQRQAQIICTPDLPHLLSDPRAIEQVFSNILDNAVKYLSPKRQGIIIVNGQCLPQQIVFSISDNGRGIAKDDWPQVFDIDRRVNPDARIRGMGMGMAFVMATMRKLGGKAWFDSTVDEGTTFYLSFPATLLAGTGKDCDIMAAALDRHVSLS
jgi:PAS domain S-box-containing protein